MFEYYYKSCNKMRSKSVMQYRRANAKPKGSTYRKVILHNEELLIILIILIYRNVIIA